MADNKKKRKSRNQRECRLIGFDETVVNRLVEIFADLIYEDMKKTGRIYNNELNKRTEQ